MCSMNQHATLIDCNKCTCRTSTAPHVTRMTIDNGSGKAAWKCQVSGCNYSEAVPDDY